MNINEINGLLIDLGLGSIDKFEYFKGSLLEKKYTLFHSPDTHSIYEFDVSIEVINAISQLIDHSLLDKELLLWCYREKGEWKKVPANTINESNVANLSGSIYLYIPPQNKSKDVTAFLELIAHLRSPQGCPWDRKQTHQTLRTNLLEETYEVLEAIDSRSPENLKEELGDLLLQIVLHAQIAQEAGNFTFGQVVNDIHHKIEHRHPHVFRSEEIDGVTDVLRNWEKIKKEERAEKPEKRMSSILTSIPGQLPALSIAQKYQERASRVGFDWEDVSPVFEKIFEEIEEVRQADPKNGLEEELGDLLFAVVNLVRWSGFDAENALRLTNKKFQRRFNFIEKKISESDRSLSDVSLSEMDALWDKAKREER